KIASAASPDVRIVSVAKGVENETLLTTTHVLDEALPSVPLEHIGVLYGPSHAEEVVEGKPAAVVAAAHSLDVASEIQDVFMTDRLRVYVNPDVTGVEIGGSVKNVLAIATGMAEGLGFGDNTSAAIVTRGLAEIRRLGIAMGANAATFGGLAGIGDLVVTCMSPLSRNRHLGELIGRGMTLAEAEQSMTMVAEGVSTTRSVHELSKRHGIELPITEAVYSILFKQKSPQEVVAELMSREAKREDWLPNFLQG
ncbi:MAG: NAD(P)H-dependent glycerol-3-phosphate dehydrogenase, partial [Bacteroidota bacterium]